MADNKDIAVLAKKVYELSVLPVPELEARKWEALLVLNAVYSAATKEGIDKANADKFARWGKQIEAEGLLSQLHPKWHLRTDDGKPPSARFALESALTNPNRNLRDRLAALMLIPPGDREPLTDLVRALNADAWDGALTDARLQYSDVLRGIDKQWTKHPWVTVLPHDDAPPPILLLIDNQGVINDGSLFDKDPTDDPLLTKWNAAIVSWDVDFLRDNPFAQLFLKAESAAEGVAAGVDAAASGAKNLAETLRWLPAALVGVAGVAGAVVIASWFTKKAQYPADLLAGSRRAPPPNDPYRTPAA